MTRKPWRIIGAVTLALLCLLAVGGQAYWRYVNYVPLYLRPRTVLPVPNAYDDFVAAGALCRATGGAAVIPAHSTGIPIYSLPKGYEDGIPISQVRTIVRRNERALARLRQGFAKECRIPPLPPFQRSEERRVGKECRL